MIDSTHCYSIVGLAVIDSVLWTARNGLDGYVTWAVTGAIPAVPISGKEGRAIFAAVKIAVLLEEDRQHVAQMLPRTLFDIQQVEMRIDRVDRAIADVNVGRIEPGAQEKADLWRSSKLRL